MFCIYLVRNANLAVSVDKRCSPEGCWYCQHCCHSCMKPASVGHTWKDGDSGQLLYHCSNRCYHMYISDSPESTILDVKVGKIWYVPVDGAHLLLSATVVFKKGLLTNSVASTQVAISYGSKEVHHGVVYVITHVITITDHALPKALFIQHDLTPVDVVWEPPVCLFTRPFITSMMEMIRKEDLIKKPSSQHLKSLDVRTYPAFLKKCFLFWMYTLWIETVPSIPGHLPGTFLYRCVMDVNVNFSCKLIFL